MGHINEIRGHIVKSFRTAVGNPLFVLSSLFVDILFFLLFGIVYSFFSTGMMEHIVEVNNIMGQINAQLAAISAGTEDNAVLSAVTSQQDAIMQHVKAIAIFAAAILISSYILWCIFQGINWHLASWVESGKKTNFPVFLGRFSLLNLVWLLGAVLIGYLTYKISVYNAMAKIAIVGQNTINYSMLFLLAVLFYFAVVSYSLAARESFLISLKNAFVLGVKRAKFYVFGYLFITLAVALIYFAVHLLRIGFVASVLVDLVLMLPVLAYGRVVFVGVSDSPEKGKTEKKGKKK